MQKYITMANIIHEIWLQQEQFIKKYCNAPDYVMIHISRKSEMQKEVLSFIPALANLDMNKAKVFGMSIIWTQNIEEDKVICAMK